MLGGEAVADSHRQNALGLAERVERRPPTAPDDLYDSEAASPVGDTSTVHDIVHQIKDGRLFKDAHVLTQLVQSLQGPINDRAFLLENLVEMLASMETVRHARSHFDRQLTTDVKRDRRPNASCRRFS